MSDHLSQDELLGLELDVFDEEEGGGRLRLHVEGCRRCRSRMGEVSVMLGERAARDLAPSRPRRRSSWRSWFLSSRTPIVTMLVVVVLSVFSAGMAAVLSLGALLSGAVVIVVWLHLVVARAESAWRMLAVAQWLEDLPLSAGERGPFVEGVRLSVVHSLIEARQKVALALSVSLGLFIVSALATLLAGVFLPSSATEVAAQRPMVLPGALAMGVLFGGIAWSSWRLRSLARKVLRFFESLGELSAGVR